jgi:uncharacterized membrane protein YhaH (DUF805 family)
MESFAQFFSPFGRTGRNSFALGAVPVYVLIVVSYLLVSEMVVTRSGVAPFALVQVALTYAWYALHARRLRDAGYGTGWAFVIALLYCLGVAVFLLLTLFVRAGEPVPGIIFYILFVVLFFYAVLGGYHTPLLGFTLGLLFVTFAPLLITVGFSIWAGTRPPLPAKKAPPPLPAEP